MSGNALILHKFVITTHLLLPSRVQTQQHAKSKPTSEPASLYFQADLESDCWDQAPGPSKCPHQQPLCTKYLTWKHLTRSSLPPPTSRHAMFSFPCLDREASSHGSCAIEVDEVGSNDP
jgi:hypothetical protein